MGKTENKFRSILESDRMEKLTDIVENSQAEKIDGILVDVQSASLVLRCYNMTGSKKVQEAIKTGPIDKVVRICWKAAAK